MLWPAPRLLDSNPALLSFDNLPTPAPQPFALRPRPSLPTYHMQRHTCHKHWYRGHSHQCQDGGQGEALQEAPRRPEVGGTELQLDGRCKPARKDVGAAEHTPGPLAKSARLLAQRWMSLSLPNDKQRE